MAGNANSGRRQEKPFRDALRLEIASLQEDDPKTLRRIARKLLEVAADGEGWAIKELADRTDGKVPQAIVGDDDLPGVNVVAEIRRTIVRPSPGA
jgi:hypothetical protein